MDLSDPLAGPRRTIRRHLELCLLRPVEHWLLAGKGRQGQHVDEGHVGVVGGGGKPRLATCGVGAPPVPGPPHGRGEVALETESNNNIVHPGGRVHKTTCVATEDVLENTTLCRKRLKFGWKWPRTSRDWTSVRCRLRPLARRCLFSTSGARSDQAQPRSGPEGLAPPLLRLRALWRQPRPNSPPYS